MYRASLRTAALAAIVSSQLLAQAGNEAIFVGSSTSGSTDQHALVESGTGNVLVASGTGFTDNCTGAVWAHQGRRVYLGQSLMNQVAEGEWNGSSFSWSTFYTAPGACYGVEYDLARKLLWTLTGPSGSTRELHCIDVDIDSPNYGSFVTQTNTLAGTSRERWSLSFAGSLACVPSVFLNGGGTIDLVDLVQSSPTFGQIVDTFTIPNASSSGFAFSSDCAISVDELYVYVLWSGISSSGLAVYDRTAGALLDFGAAAGQQDLALPQSVPNLMDLSLDRTFAVISGQGGSGWAGRVDFDYATPSNTTFTQYTGLTVPDCNGISLSPEETRVAVTSTPTFLATPSYLTVFDVDTGTVLQNVTLSSMWNVYTTAWQDESPVATYLPYGTGCSGTIGTPTLAVGGGSRPAIGSTLSVDVSNLPFGIAAFTTGLSSTMTSGGLPLPFDLTLVGMTGCTQYADALLIDAIQDVGTTATWSWTIPNNPSLFGATIYNQAYSLDPAANSFGFVASNAGAGKIGF